MDEPTQILELFGKRATVIKPGLDRIQRTLEALGWPCRDIPVVIVGGTNGKGSTSGLLWHMLAACGVRAGYFSSPHLVEFKERIAVVGCEVSNELLCDFLGTMKERLDRALWEELTFFEINTALAFMIFQKLGTEICVLEVGLGGRFDCTNVYDSVLSIITTIGLDHMEFLGNTTGDIAREKAGIMRPRVPCLWGGLQSSDQAADAVVRSEASRIGSSLKISGIDFPATLDPPVAILWPSFIKRNYALARHAMDLLADVGLVGGLNRDQVGRQIAARFASSDLPWPITLTGRFQCVRVTKENTSRRLIFDVCHNPHGASAFARGLEETGLVPQGQKRPALISILRDKDGAGIWRALRGKISEALLFQISSERTWTEENSPVPGPMFASFRDAFGAAVRRPEWSDDDKQPWLVCGSVAAVGSVLRWFREDGWSVESWKESMG